MRLKVNPEFVRRYAFAGLVFAGMGGWFAFDGLVRYPQTDAAALYESIEKAPPPETMSVEALERFKAQKIQTQYGLAAILLAVAGWVGLSLLRACRFSFDPETCGKVTAVDRRRWTKKGILRIRTECGWTTLDAWHHLGVADFEKTLPQNVRPEA